MDNPLSGNVPIDWAAIDWIYVGVLAVFAYLSALIGQVVSLRHRGLASLVAALIFAVLFVAWTYYPHGLPLPTRLR